MGAAVEDIFVQALSVSREDLTGFLNDRCGDDAALIAEVRRLLDAHKRANSFLERPVAVVVVEPEQQDQHGDEWIGKSVGPYRLTRLLGEGGCGRVYLAEQEIPVRRRAAVKIVRPSISTREMLARFNIERQALVELDHPNIAKLYEAGQTENGLPFFAMEYVGGLPVTLHCEKHELATDQRLEMFVHICDAVQHVHLRGIIHRDLKPSNILVSEQDGQPRVIDFGIAKSSDGHLSGLVTQVGAPVGTLEYMSPEQMRAEPGGVDVRTDVYSLGVILYELLTGSRPFEVSRLSPSDAERWIRDHEPLRASTRVSRLANTRTPLVSYRELKGDLDWILLKAMDKDRNRRYTTVQQLAADVRRFRNNQPIEARPPSAAYKIRKFVARNKALSTAALVCILALVTATTISTLAAERALRAEHKATDAAIKSERLAYRTSIVAAGASVERDPMVAKQALDDAPQAMRDWEWHYLHSRSEAAPAFYTGETMSAGAAAPDGGAIAVGLHRGDILVWTAASQEPRRLAGHTSRVQMCKFSTDGRKLLSCASDGTVRVWDVAVGESMVVGTHEAGVAWAAWDGSENRIASGDSKGGLRVWSVDGTMVREFRLPCSVYAVVFAGEELISGGQDGVVRVWDASGGALLREWKAGRQGVRGLALVNENQEVILGNLDGSVARWDIATGERLLTYRESGPSVRSIDRSPDGSLIAVGDRDGDAIVWECLSGARAALLPGQDSFIEGLGFLGSHSLVTATWQGRVRYWRFGAEQAQRIVSNDSGRPVRVALSDDGSEVLALTTRGESARWSTGTGERMSLEGGAERGTTWSVDGSTGWAAWTESSPSVEVFNLRDSANRRQVTLAQPATFTVVSADGKRIALGFESGEVEVRRVDDGALLHLLKGEEGCTTLAISAEGEFVAAGFRNATGVLWDLRSEPVRSMVQDLSYHAVAAVFSGDSKRVAFGTLDNTSATIWLLDTYEGGAIRSFGGLGTKIRTMAFSPSGQRLVTGGDHHAIRVWSIEDGKELLSLRQLDGNVGHVAFSRDGSTLAACTQQGSIYLFGVSRPKWPWSDADR